MTSKKQQKILNVNSKYFWLVRFTLEYVVFYSDWGFDRRRLVPLFEIGVIYADTRLTVPVEITETCAEFLAYPAALWTVCKTRIYIAKI